MGRSDSTTDSEIDLFDLAFDGKKTGTLRLGEHAATFQVGQFVFLRARNKRLCLVQIASVSQPEAWGAICSDPVRKTLLVAMEGLNSCGDPAFPGSSVDIWT